MLRYMTAGESHGQALVAILEGLPSNLPLSAEEMNRELQRRQQGYGRGGRMKIERDEVELLSGVRHGLTLGSPIALMIRNRDWENWRATMAPDPEAKAADHRPPVTRPRPGHADLPGGLKYDFADLRNVLERASARETAARVAVGAACKALLRAFDVRIAGHVVEIGGIVATLPGASAAEIAERAEASEVRCADPDAERAIIAKIDEARGLGTSVGGVFEVLVLNVPVGLGSYVHWDRRLDGRLAQALMSIQAIKGVEVGLGFEAARRFGLETHDEIYYEGPGAGGRGPDAEMGAEMEHRIGFYRRTQRAGGLEGGMTNGEPIIVRAAMKPISTQYRPLASVDLATKAASPASVERSDVCAVPAACVIGEAVVAFEIARALREKFGGDSLGEMRRNFDAYQAQVRAR